MDAEDVSDIMNALWERLDKAIVEHGGTIDKHIGDEVMALWGTETAREDDPEWAIRAALAMQTELTAFRHDQSFDLAQDRQVDLAMRIGINTGPVLLGKVGTTGECTAMGDTVNLASRLEGAAPVGGILISHDTYRHVRGVFDVQVLEPIEVKGKREPIQVYVVERAKPRAFRMGRRGVEGVETRMIGREAELKQLQDALYAAMEEGEQQMVTITGETGVGKSRLLYEFENWVELLPERIRYFKGRASPEMQNLPYALIRDLFSFRFQIQDSDRARVVWQQVEAGVGEVLGTNERGQMRAHFIGQLLGFDFSDSPHLQGTLDDAKQLRDRALIYLTEFFQATTELAPTIIFLEDVHWADDSSLDVINHLARTTPDRRLPGPAHLVRAPTALGRGTDPFVKLRAGFSRPTGIAPSLQAGQPPPGGGNIEKGGSGARCSARIGGQWGRGQPVLRRRTDQDAHRRRRHHQGGRALAH